MEGENKRVNKVQNRIHYLEWIVQVQKNEFWPWQCSRKLFHGCESNFERAQLTVVLALIDDVLALDQGFDSHICYFVKVFQRFRENGIKLKREKIVTI